MRTIEFRGLSEKGKWHYGFYIGTPEGEYIEATVNICACDDAPLGDTITHRQEVQRETVGQYTGLTDKNGVKIFEGDVLSGICINASIQYCNVEFSGGCFLVVQQSGEKLVELLDNNKKVCEIIGNIHGVKGE